MATPNPKKLRPLQFECVCDYSDHHYAKNPSPPSSSTRDTRIMREWRILEKALPDSIYVRVYDSWTYLMRAAIIGAPATPYHDGIFIFDIFFPSDYPIVPPQVYYHSFGYRLNPNLHKNGVVCLSLLNTWDGNGCEKWDIGKSTVLQVLLSIQGLVLNTEPYYNEPYLLLSSRWPSARKKSLAYDEKAYIYTLQTLICLIRKPPKNFEDLVISHVKNRACAILTACRAYRQSYIRVGSFRVEGVEALLGCERVEPSRHFKEAMDALYPKMVEVFSQSGASVGHFMELLRKEREWVVREEKQRFWEHRIIGKVWKILEYSKNSQMYILFFFLLAIWVVLLRK